MDGIIVINKTKGCTSHDIVYKVKKMFNEKVGHTGTLDPNATGVLPILLGKGTLVSKYLINHDKTYEAKLKLGEKRDTADSEGNIIEKEVVPDISLEIEFVKQTLKKFVGKHSQIPPMYSAIKVKGKKLYEYARKGENVDVKPRQIEIYDINLSNIDKDNSEISFVVRCSKGTYIRTLCEDIAKALGTVGYMKELNRTQVGIFNINEAVTLEELEQNIGNKFFLKGNFISIEDLFKNKPSIVLKNRELEKLLNGVKLNFNLEEGIYRIYNSNSAFIGIATLQNGLLKRDVIIY